MQDKTHDNSKNGFITSIWGKFAWNHISFVAFNYPIDPTSEDKLHYKAFIENFVYTLPCNLCKESCKNFVVTEPTILNDDVFASRDNLVEYIYKLHNRVNEKLEVMYPITLDEFKEKYESFRVKCMSNREGCVMSIADKQKAFINADKKECQIIDYNKAASFVEYAKKRGINIKDCIDKYNKMDKHGKDWEQRNKLCYQYIRKLRLNGIRAIEKEGEFKGLPTVDELCLISMLCTTLCRQDLNNAIEKVNKIKSST